MRILLILVGVMVCKGCMIYGDFMVTMIGATICSSGQDYNKAVERFFPQLQALGELIEVSSLDEISACMRGAYSPG